MIIFFLGKQLPRTPGGGNLKLASVDVAADTLAPSAVESPVDLLPKPVIPELGRLMTYF